MWLCSCFHNKRVEDHKARNKETLRPLRTEISAIHSQPVSIRKGLESGVHLSLVELYLEVFEAYKWDRTAERGSGKLQSIVC